MTLYILSSLIIFSVVGVLSGVFWFLVSFRIFRRHQFQRRLVKDTYVRQLRAARRLKSKTGGGGLPLAGGTAARLALGR